MTQDLLDISEAAAFLRVSEASLRRWTNAGQLPCLRIGGRQERRFRRADLLAFLSAKESGPPADRATHLCGLYTSPVSRVRELATCVLAGLQQDAFCILLAKPDVQKSVIAQVEKQRPAAKVEVGEYCSSVADQLNFWRERLGRALAGGAQRLVVAADVSGGGLGRLPFAEVLEYEAEYDREIARVYPVTTLCHYDARALSGLDAAGLLQRHDGITPPHRSQH